MFAPSQHPISTDTEKAIQVPHTTHATAIKGRDGRAMSNGKHLDVALKTPKELGGAVTNPEQLVAAGYATSLVPR